MFGVCYYPEHWAEDRWAEDAARMADLGLSNVRIGEFAWSRFEPEPGELHFDWFDRAIAVLNDAGLAVVIGTPTATPPKWLVDRWPEVLPVNSATGQVRGFGSRRHYDFSSDVYLREATRITSELARRYGQHDGVVGWQTDNELCCHDTSLSGSAVARSGFQNWCRKRYGAIDTLNNAWGNVFWSMEYRDFDEIEPPFGAVTETNPAHQLAYRRYASDRVIAFNQCMVEAIREHSAGQFVTHNFIPMVDTGIDNFALAESLDFASYDNYPLGRSDLRFAKSAPAEFRRYMRTGHPDLASYFHDQTRGLSKRGFWVMEQQPGPVNWALHNPQPAPGLVRLWTFEAFAHGADCVAYFRWRQAPFAQEQMHAGLLRPDDSKASGWAEVEQAIAELARLGDDLGEVSNAVAIVTAAESQWISDIEQQGAGYAFDDVQFQYYMALRQIGIDVDFVSPDTDLGDYRLLVVPSLPILDAAWVETLASLEATVVFGPRSGAKTEEFQIPETLPPGPLQRLLPMRVLSVDTLRPDCPEALTWNGQTYQGLSWREHVDPGDCEIVARFSDGNAGVLRQAKAIYIASLTDDAFLGDFLASLADTLGVERHPTASDLRVCRRGSRKYAFNYGQVPVRLEVSAGARFVLGSPNIAMHDIAIWEED